MASSQPALPAGFEAGPAAHRDLPAIDELYRRSEVALGVRPEPRTAYLTWRWSQPYVDLARDTRVVRRDGQVIGFAGSHREDDAGPLFAMGRVDPDARGRGVGSWMLHWFDWAAAGRGAAKIWNGCPTEDTATQTLFAAHGYERVRTSLDMGVDLSGREAPPTPPESVTIRAFAPGEERTLWQVMNGAFRDHWDHERDQPFATFLSEWFGDTDDAARILVAEVEGSMVGELAWVRADEGAYVTSVGVLAPARRRGIAGALLGTAMANAAAQGFRHLSLSVDGASPTGAVVVYERAGLQVLRSVEIFIKDRP